MTNFKTTKRALLSSVVALFICFTMLLGTTFAWFTDSVTSSNNIIQTGTLEIGMYWAEGSEAVPADNSGWTDASQGAIFNNTKWEPGYVEAKHIKIANEGTLALKYKLLIVPNGEVEALADVIDVYYVENATQITDRDMLAGRTPVGTLRDMIEDTDGAVHGALLPVGETATDTYERVGEVTATIAFKMQETAGNEYQGKKIGTDFAIQLLATQYTYEDDSFDNKYDEGATYPTFADKWDGTADTSWYNDTDTMFTLNTAEQLAGFAKLVDDGNTFEGKTIKLTTDVNLYALDADVKRINFNPIGHSSNGKSFNGVFDGQGHTISNLYEQNDLGAWQYEGEYYGLFAYTNGAIIKDVTIADAYISSGRNEAAGVVGNAVDTTFSDITISKTTLIAYNNSAGGVAAECYGNCSFTDIIVDEDTVIGPLWGTYDVRLGGVVGMVKASDKVTFSNITVACKLDAINDVAANYQYWLYRYSGMLIGQVDEVNGVADPTGYVTCENVTVIYGDWVNYHYCEDADLGAGSYNGPGEYKYARVEAGTGTDGIDTTTCNHNKDESHNVLIVFDQLFGGGQGVKGLKTYEGVTVIYPEG